MTITLRSSLLLALFTAGLLPGIAQAHSERQSFFPTERVSQRPAYRPMLPEPQSPRRVVCKRPGDEGIAEGDDSASRIARIQDPKRRAINAMLYQECAFEHLQAAVDAVVQRGTTIYVLPGVYREQPSIRALDERAGASTPADQTFCAAVLARGPGKLSYEEQFRCRHIQNTVAIFGDPNFVDDNCGSDLEGVCANPQTQACDPAQSACQYLDLQIEGTGEINTDVIFEGDFITKPGDPVDGQFRYLNGIRADRTDSIYLKNFTTQIFEFNSIYMLEVDGGVMDGLMARWVDEYSYLTFACDHILYDTVEGYGAADSVVYPGSGADIYKAATHANANLRVRQGTEVRNSYAHHASGGYSGTAGNSPWVHDNNFSRNQTGLATESVYGGHPGMPQDHGLYENNLIYSNNKNYFGFVENDGPCIAQTPRDRGVVPPEFRTFDAMPDEVKEAILDRLVLCPGIPFPSGTAMLIGGGNYDVFQNNQVFDSWKYGLMIFHVPTAIRYTDSGPDEYATANPYDNGHYNRGLNNNFAENVRYTPSVLQPNANDVWYDNSGVGNCFDGNTSVDPAGFKGDTGNPALALPGGPCTDGPVPDPATQTATAQNDRIAFIASCVAYDRNDPATKSPNCPFFDVPVAPAGRQGFATVIASHPPDAKVGFGNTSKVGYFVLHNDTGGTHTLAGATILASGPTGVLAGLTLDVTLAEDGKIVTHTAALVSPSGDNTFTFDSPVPVPPDTFVLFELHATAPTTLAAGDGPVMLASGAAAAFGLGVLMLGGAVRRSWLMLVLAIGTAGTFISCTSSTPVGGGPIGFTLQSLDISSPGGVSYSGLPARIGSVEIRP